MKARILVDQPIDGLQYRANQVVELTAAMAKALEKEGLIDTHRDAVAYCTEELGVKVLTHETEQQRAAKEALLAAETARNRIKADLSAETDAAKRDALTNALAEAEEAVVSAAASAAAA